MSRKYKSIEIETRLVFARTWGEGRKGITANGYVISIFGVKMFENYMVVMTVQLSEYTENHWSLHFQNVNFMLF